MRDPMPVMETLGEKLWVTKENDTYHLFEYSNKTMFRRDIATKRYKLDYPFKCCAIKAPSWPACDTICGPSFEQRITYRSRRWGTEDCRCANSIKEAVMSCLLYICKSIKSCHKSGQVWNRPNFVRVIEQRVASVDPLHRDLLNEVVP
ncbi:unnamed protein product, partial [Timema podura]|nr:unnamed protein product [Timema podura]